MVFIDTGSFVLFAVLWPVRGTECLARSRCSINKEGRKGAHSCDGISQRHVQGHSRRRERTGRLCVNRPLCGDLGEGRRVSPARKPRGTTLAFPLQHFGPQQGRTSSRNGENLSWTLRRALATPPAAAGQHTFTCQVPQQPGGRLMAEKSRESNTQTSSLLNNLRFRMTYSLLGKSHGVSEFGAGLLNLSTIGIWGQILLCYWVSCSL